MIKRLLLAGLLALTTSGAWAQNVTCATRPTGDSSNACASTAFVNNTLAAGIPLANGKIFVGNASNIAAPNDITAILTAGANIAITGTTNATIATVQNPTFTTSVTSPIHQGGTTASSSLTLRSTSGVGTSDLIDFKTGNNRSQFLVDTAGRFLSSTGTTTAVQPTRNAALNPLESFYDGPYPSDAKIAVSESWTNAAGGDPFVYNQISSVLVGTGNVYSVPLWGVSIGLSTGATTTYNWGLAGFAANWNHLDNQTFGAEIGVIFGHTSTGITGDATKTWALALSAQGERANAHPTGYMYMTCAVVDACPQQGIILYDSFINPFKPTASVMATSFTAGIGGGTKNFSAARGIDFRNTTFSSHPFIYGTGTACIFCVDQNGLVTAATGSSGGYAIGSGQILTVASSLTQLKDPDFSTRLYLGPAAAPTNFYDNTTHTFRNRAGSTTWATLNTSSFSSTVPILAPDGAVGAPGVAFSSQANTGIFYAANTMQFATQGTLRAYFNSTGLNLVSPLAVASGGVGVASPAPYLASSGTLDMNVTTDQAVNITLPSGYTRYKILQILFYEPSISLTTAAGGLYTAAAKGGVAILPAATTYSALTATGPDVTGSLTTAAGNINTLFLSDTSLFFSLTTPQGAASTAKYAIYVMPLP